MKEVYIKPQICVEDFSENVLIRTRSLIDDDVEDLT